MSDSLKRQFVRDGQKFSLKHSKQINQQYKQECEETAMLTLCQRRRCFRDVN